MFIFIHNLLKNFNQKIKNQSYKNFIISYHFQLK